jgi:hypothetical protein
MTLPVPATARIEVEYNRIRKRKWLPLTLGLNWRIANSAYTLSP